MKTYKQFIQEAVYKGNLGLAEIVAFMQKATPEEKQQFQAHVKAEREKEAWDMVQKKLNVKLHPSAWGGSEES